MLYGLTSYHRPMGSPTSSEWGQIPGIIGGDEHGTRGSYTASNDQGEGKSIHQPDAETY